MKKFIPLVITILVFVGTMLYSDRVNDECQSRYNKAVAEKEQIEAEVNEKIETVTNDNKQVIQNVTGLDDERKNRDNKYIGSFLDEVLTWHSYAEYCQARESIAEKYNPDKDFMAMFFPEVPCKISPDGTNYNRIDTRNLTMEYVNLDSYITDISNGVYTYFAKVTVQSVSNGGESQATLVIEYSIDEDGKVTNIQGIL